GFIVENSFERNLRRRSSFDLEHERFTAEHRCGRDYWRRLFRHHRSRAALRSRRPTFERVGAERAAIVVARTRPANANLFLALRESLDAVAVGIDDECGVVVL